MPLSLALVRHRLSQARDVARLRPGGDPPWPGRPEGRLIWVHISGASFGAELLVAELREIHPDLDLLATGEWTRPPPDACVTAAPGDTAAAARRFLDHFRPDLVIFAGPGVYPLIWSEAADRGIPQVALDAEPYLHAVPLVRPLSRFAFTAFRRPDSRLARGGDSIGALNDVPPPPPVAKGEVERMAAHLASRPVWFAASVPASEIEDVLAAHTLASRLAHRLLLVLEPAECADGAGLKSRLDLRGWPAVRRAQDARPGDETRVLIADAPEETGLWVRLASITYLGGTLRGGAVGCSPFVPAALGSVVLHGSRHGEAAAALARLQGGDAAWSLDGHDDLGLAVERFLAPDLAAEMAQAGWNVTSRDAEVSGAALDAIDDLVTAMETP